MLTVDLEVLRRLRGHEESLDACRAGPFPAKSGGDRFRWWYGGRWNVGDCHPCRCAFFGHFTRRILRQFVDLQVIKSRIQSAPEGMYRGFIDCARKTIAADGARALLKGFWPAMGRVRTLMPFHLLDA
jgi:hypothetical protein